jgi:hypothetical protein
MKSTVVVGAQWGDKGKGKVVDYLAPSFDYIARCAGTMRDTRLFMARESLCSATDSVRDSAPPKTRGHRFGRRGRFDGSGCGARHAGQGWNRRYRAA